MKKIDSTPPKTPKKAIRHKLQAFCSVCGARCPGKLKVEARKGTLYICCIHCFNNIGDLKELRKKIQDRR